MRQVRHAMRNVGEVHALAPRSVFPPVAVWGARSRLEGPWGRSGFTLVEVLLAAAMSLLIVIGAYIVYDHGQSTFTRTERRTDIQQNARAAMDLMARQIRTAGYFASNDPDPPRVTPVVIGTANLLVIRGDVRVKDPALAFPGVDTIFGVLSIANPPWCPATPPPQVPCLMTHTPETDGTNVYAVGAAKLALAYGITGITFRYFNAANAELAAPLDGKTTYPSSATPVDLSAEDTTDRNAVQRVQVTITAEAAAFAGPGAVPQTYVLTQDIRIRNNRN